MRLTASQIDFIRQLTAQLASGRTQVCVFGSRLDDAAKGGDLDLLLELPEPVQFLPARMVAKERNHLLVTDQYLFSQLLSLFCGAWVPEGRSNHMLAILA